MQLAIASASIVVSFVLLLGYSSHVIKEDHARSLLSDCIDVAAKANHYPSPYSKEAWDIFYDQCSK